MKHETLATYLSIYLSMIPLKIISKRCSSFLLTINVPYLYLLYRGQQNPYGSTLTKVVFFHFIRLTIPPESK